MTTQLNLGTGNDLILSRSTSTLLDDLGAGNASPGSGSASALMALLAISMIKTVCLKSLEKDECKKFHKQCSFILGEIKDKHEPELKKLFESDAKIFKEVVELRVERDLTNDAQNKKRISKQSNDKLENANELTYKIAEHALKLVGFGIDVFNYGWKSVRGDSGVAISCAIAAVSSVIFINHVNIKVLKNRKKYSEEANTKTKKLTNTLVEKQELAFKCITDSSIEALTDSAPLSLDV